MSQEDVEIVRRMHDAYARGDLQVTLACFDPELELSTAPSEPGTSTYRGIEGLREATTKWVGTWDDFHIDVEELTDLGEHVLARLHERGRGRGSGVEVERELFQLFTIRGDKIVRLRMFDTSGEALRAAGFSEQEVGIRNEAVGRFLTAFEDDDDAFRAALHPEIEWYPIEENRTPTRGVDAALWNRNQWLDTWDEHELEVEEVVEDEDNIVVGIHIRARGRASGVEADLRFFVQIKVRDGKVAYIYDHDDRTAALEAAGLED
jgi:ketosteroid isomerase-like protein